MSVSIKVDEKYNGHQMIVLENELLKVVIMPDLGAKIQQITYKPKEKDLLWNHPRLELGKVAFRSDYEDAFFGGWDELFPNDMVEELNGKVEPDHGEIWALSWEFRLEKDTQEEATIYLWVNTEVCNCKIEKWITLKSGESKLYFHHAITNLSIEDQPFLWKLHPALIMDEDCQIDQGASKMLLMDIGNPRKEAQFGEYNWPYMTDAAGVKQDMRIMLNPDTKVKEIQYAQQIDAGWCALTNKREQIGFGLSFDRRIFPSLFIFSSHGGWDGEQIVILEPCTGYAMNVNEGIKQGTHQILKAGERIETDLVAVVYTGLTSVSSIDSEGGVCG